MVAVPFRRSDGIIEDPGAPAEINISLVNIINIAVNPNQVSEDGRENLVYTFTRFGDTSKRLGVDFRLRGNARVQDDYRIRGVQIQNNRGTVNFRPNSQTAQVIVAPLRDNEVENNETVSLRLLNKRDYLLGEQNEATGIISNDDLQMSNLGVLNAEKAITSENVDLLSTHQLSSELNSGTAVDNFVATNPITVEDTGFKALTQNITVIPN